MTRRKERYGGRNDEEEGVTRRKERHGGRNDEEEGVTRRKELGEGRSYDTRRGKIIEKKRKRKKLLEDATLTALVLSPSVLISQRMNLCFVILGASFHPPINLYV